MVDVDPQPTQGDLTAETGIAAELESAGFDDPREIGRGGFGIVYRCLQRSLDRTVAIKIVSSNADEQNRERFLREQHAMGRLSGHPNIVTILQVGVTAAGRPFIVMPYHARDSLEARIRQAGPFSVGDALQFGVKLAGALETAHRAGILHRDIKPANILLSEYGEPQLTDFGIARIAGGFQTSAGMVAGSPAYTAPELLAGATPTTASDVYGLGATLFCMITGHAAFERRSGEQVVAQFLRITSQPVPDLRHTGLPEDVCAAIERAMAQDPADRFASAADFGNELRRAEQRLGLNVQTMAMPDADGAEEPSPDVTPATGARTRVLIADDHPVFRDGLARLFEQHPDFEVVAVAADGDRALAELRRTVPDVAVLDLGLPGLDGIAIIEAVERDGLPTRAVIISAAEDSATVYRAIAAGAGAYLLKVVSGETVCETVLAVAGGATVIPPELQTGFAEELRRQSGPQTATLTARELDVLRLAADGLSIKDIAAELFVGVTTVKTHLQHVYDKLGVNDRGAAVAAGMRRGLLT
jgi:serine/threonine-protein kinase PknK